MRSYQSYSVLQSACGLMKLKMEAHIAGAGDHDIFICNIEDWETAGNTSSCTGSSGPLYTGTLRDLGLL